MADNQVDDQANSPVSQVSESMEGQPPPEQQPVVSETQLIHSLRHLEPQQSRTRDVLLVFVRQFGFQALLWLQLLWNLLSYAASTTQSVSRSVLRGLQSQVYVFFKESNYPYRLQDTNLIGPGIAPVDWYYDADKKLFLASNLYNTTTEYTTHHLEWLTGQIKYNDLILYDISDYVQEVKWAGSTKPSAARVLAAWSTHSGIVLNNVESVVLQVINEDGTESSLPIRG
jgi:hypothetical protein